LNAKRRSITAAHATIIAALIALSGTVITILVGPLISSDHSLPALPANAKSTSSDIELVDVSAAERGRGTVFLDIKTRNIGPNTSILKRAIVHVRNWQIIDTCAVGAPLPVSSTYQMKLPSKPPGPQFDVPIELSESLQPNEASRIKIETGLDIKDPDIDGMVIQMQLELQLDKSAHVISEPILMSLPGQLSPKDHWRNMPTDFGFRECAVKNLKDLDFMLNLPGRRSPDLQQLTNE
jgi:hypothetical protein